MLINFYPPLPPRERSNERGSEFVRIGSIVSIWKNDRKTMEKEEREKMKNNTAKRIYIYIYTRVIGTDACRGDSFERDYAISRTVRGLRGKRS